MKIANITIDCTDAKAMANWYVDKNAKHLGDFEVPGIKWATFADPEGNLFDVSATP
jgi:hypothetical protein